MLNKLKRAALGAHTPHDKATAASKPVPMPLPAQVRILMSQHIGAPAKALVKKGDEVFVGTKIGEAGGFVSANIHSSVSGTVGRIFIMSLISLSWSYFLISLLLLMSYW